MVLLVKALRAQEQMKVMKCAMDLDGFVIRECGPGCGDGSHYPVPGRVRCGIRTRLRQRSVLTVIRWQCGPNGQSCLQFTVVADFIPAQGARALLRTSKQTRPTQYPSK